MSASTAKASRREIRRAVGSHALNVISSHEQFVQRQAQGNQSVDERLADLKTELATVNRIVLALDASVQDHVEMTRWERIRWVLGL